jgi:hypothetical protein
MTALNRWLLFAHVAGVLLYVGGTLSLLAHAIRYTKLNDPVSLLKTVMGARPVIYTGVIVTLLAGLSLVLTSEVWSFSKPFVMAGLGAMIIGFSMDRFYIAPRGKKVHGIIQERGPQDPAILPILRSIVAGAAFSNSLFIIVVWFMVFKPE